MKPLFDIKTAAQLLAVSPWTIRAYIRQKKLRPVRLGRLVRLDQDELQRFIAEAKGNGDKNVNHNLKKESEDV